MGQLTLQLKVFPHVGENDTVWMEGDDLQRLAYGNITKSVLKKITVAGK